MGVVDRLDGLSECVEMLGKASEALVECVDRQVRGTGVDPPAEEVDRSFGLTNEARNLSLDAQRSRIAPG